MSILSSVVLVNLVVAAITALIVTWLSIPFYIKLVSKIGLKGIDQQKEGKPELATSGGIPAFSGLMLGVMVFILLTAFSNGFNDIHVIKQKMFLLAGVLAIGIITVVGLFDDIYMKKIEARKRSDTVEKRHGLKQWLKPLLTFFGAIPLIVVMAGSTLLGIPLIGTVDFGIFYPLVLIPLAVICVSNATNMLAGFNGLEAGLMVVASFTLAVFCFLWGRLEGAVIALTLCFASLAFLKFNWFPAKILPGDSLTYFLGGAFVTAVIIGDVERFGMLIFLPWVVEAILKLRGRFNVRSFGDLQKDGTLKAPYPKIYSLTHIVMLLPEKLWGKRLKEKQVVMVLIAFEVILCIALFLFYQLTL